MWSVFFALNCGNLFHITFSGFTWCFRDLPLTIPLTENIEVRSRTKLIRYSLWVRMPSSVSFISCSPNKMAYDDLSQHPPDISNASETRRRCRSADRQP